MVTNTMRRASRRGRNRLELLASRWVPRRRWLNLRLVLLPSLLALFIFSTLWIRSIGFAQDTHSIGTDGLLHVDMNGTLHPITALIDRGEKRWKAKVARQSRTLKVAVETYRERYNREPPRGFDQWWKYAVKHNILLVDEYEQIEKDLEPFRILSPAALRQRNDRAAKQRDTYWIRVKNGMISTGSAIGLDIAGQERREHQMELLQPIAQSLKDMLLVHSVHDTPAVLLDYSSKAAMLELREQKGRRLETHEVDDVIIRRQASSFRDHCPPGTAIHTAKLKQSRPGPESSNKSFIAEPTETYDVCDNPSLLHLHGAFKAPQMTTDLVPVFSASKPTVYSDILVPSLLEYYDDLDEADLYPFMERTENRLLWRGRNTGTRYDHYWPWRQTQRMRLVSGMNRQDDTLLQILPPSLSRGVTLSSGILNTTWAEATRGFMDVAFARAPINCEPEICEEIVRDFRRGEVVSVSEAFNYRYILDVDGNAWSSRFNRILRSGSLIFKSTIFPEWFTGRIEPWVHYIPIQADYSDLFDALVYFRGDQQGKGSHLDVAAKIAKAGADFAKQQWRLSDMTAYIFRLYLEWERLLSEDDDRDFVYKKEMERRRA